MRCYRALYLEVRKVRSNHMYGPYMTNLLRHCSRKTLGFTLEIIPMLESIYANAR